MTPESLLLQKNDDEAKLHELKVQANLRIRPIEWCWWLVNLSENRILLANHAGNEEPYMSCIFSRKFS